MFLEWGNNSGKLQIISWKFQNNTINDVKQISLSHVIKLFIHKKSSFQNLRSILRVFDLESSFQNLRSILRVFDLECDGQTKPLLKSRFLVFDLVFMKLKKLESLHQEYKNFGLRKT